MWSSTFIDELGYLNLKPEQTNIFFKLMEERYRRRPTIITTNLDYPEWQTFLGNSARGGAPQSPPPSVPHHPNRRPFPTGSSRLIANSDNGAWTLPHPWTHRTRSPVLAKPQRTRFRTAPTPFICVLKDNSMPRDQRRGASRNPDLRS